MKIQEYLARNSYPLPRLDHGIGLKEYFSEQLLIHPSTLVDARDRIKQEKNSGTWIEKPQQTLEWVLSTLPSSSFSLMVLGQPDGSRKEELSAVFLAAREIDEWVDELVSAGADIFCPPNNRKIKQVFGSDTPLFLIGSILGRTRLVRDFSRLSQAQLVQLIAHAARVEDIETINKNWHLVDARHNDRARKEAWMSLPLPLSSSSFPLPDPPIDWWKNALVRNPLSSPGRQHLICLASNRPHLADTLRDAQLSSGRREIEAATTQSSNKDGADAIQTILVGWGQKIEGRIPTPGNLVDLSRRIEAASPSLNRAPDKLLDLAWAQIATSIQSLDTERARHSLAPLFDLSLALEGLTVSTAFSQIWQQPVIQSSELSTKLCLLDLARMALRGEAQQESVDSPATLHSLYSLKMNILLRLLFETHQAFGLGDIFDVNSQKQAQRVLRPNWPGKAAPLSSLEPAMKSSQMEISLWQLILSRLSGRRVGLFEVRPLGNKEKGLVRNIQLMDSNGATLWLPGNLSQAMEQALREDPEIPDWLTSLLQRASLQGGVIEEKSGGRRRL